MKLAQLKPGATFSAKVPIPVAGGKSEPISFTFKHKTRAEYFAWLDGIKGKGDVDIVLDIVTGWEFEDEFSRASVETLIEDHIGAGVAVFETYCAELVKARTKN